MIVIAHHGQGSQRESVMEEWLGKQKEWQDPVRIQALFSQLPLEKHGNERQFEDKVCSVLD